MDNFLSVSIITGYIKNKLDTDVNLQKVYLKGEISNFKHHSRGHMYFTLKDETSQISAVMFASKTYGLKFIPEDGQNVLVEGYISIYEKTGSYQIYVNKMNLDGVGNLFTKYLMLKEKLEREGLFDTLYKKEIPKFPKKIAVITSPTGAAVRDIITTINRRYNIAEVALYPVLVQGNEAKYSISEAIERVNSDNNFDVIICGRGGGSIEDLWAFNEEIVAYSIFNSKIPIICGVGHETDFTIADFVADKRAATPTAAAELAVPNKYDLNMLIKKDIDKLNSLINIKYESSFSKYKYLSNSIYLKHPDRIFSNYEMKYGNLFERLKAYKPKNIINNYFDKVHSLSDKLNTYYTVFTDKKSMNVNNCIDKLIILNPLNLLKSGYSIAQKDNKVISSVTDVRVNDNVKVNLSNGYFTSVITEIKEGEIND